ncbi:hypothetical protein L210DRAFT_3159615 [Boletus edulis BED1]|uniref:Protein kinase domain-containing protein n=1 Tax=Boletus edulis BED1 TaxID=1328754 RepID=A0AAD4BY03_BOLED|nr:hypothetical protein L210DRAFT_3159615 [Boletus edulis BED1]
MDSPSEVSDVFSLSDHLLAERLQFVKEIGFGNWGSVWLCRPKSSSGKVKDMEVAVKLVHRSKTSTTAARVRSLWNEMKIVRSFKNDPHPSIVPFHSFIITPSYALITMAYLPTLVPVEVSESRAKEWFKSLLSGVHFLHSRGVVHNDIKPANILLSRANIPVLVDFGFSEQYDLASPKAFHSNLTYGTPEYLSPERARGLPHDTRKSDIWSLGVTFFEILVGRTPFEYEEGEVFEKKEDLEKYWNRTMRGKWVGKYSVSQPVERLLKRMIIPNADLRCTAAELIGDTYWDANPVTTAHGHRKSASAAAQSTAHARGSSFFNSFKESFKDKDKEPSLSRLLDISLPWTESASRPASRIAVISHPALRAATPRVPSATSLASQPRTPKAPPETKVASNHRAIVEQESRTSTPDTVRTRTHSRSKSQPRLRSPPGIITTARARKLSTVQASPLVRPQRQIGVEMESDVEKDTSACRGWENMNASKSPTSVSRNSNSSMKRPLGPRQPSPRVTSVFIAVKESSVPSKQVGTTEDKYARSHLAHVHTPETKYPRTRTRTPVHFVTSQSVPQTPTRAVSSQTPLHTTQTSQQTSASKQLSGKPPRARGRAGVLTDLTGFARNVDLGAHGVGHPVKRGVEKRDRGKENARGRTTVQKENKENEGLPAQVHVSRKDSRVPSRRSGTAPLGPKTPVKEQGTSRTLAASLSGATTVARGSVRDRMMDWERERERLREMNRLTDTSTDGHDEHDSTSTSSSSSDDDDSGVEAEVIAEVASAQAETKLPTELETPEEVKTKVEGERPTTTQTTTTVFSSSSNLERSQIEIAKIGVRASAQILSSRKRSITALGRRSQSVGKQLTVESQVDSVTDMGLPIEMRRSESGLNSLKHSVKASIGYALLQVFYPGSTYRSRCTGPMCLS